MPRIFFSLLFLSISFFVTGQKQVTNTEFNSMLNELLTHSVPELLPNECNSLSNDVLFLDTREKVEYDVSHLPNSQWVGYNSFKMKNVKSIPKDQPIIVYCTVGYRSEKITEKLQKNGFTNVSNLYGGIFEWMHAGNSIENVRGITKEVHTYDANWAKWLNDSLAIKIR